MKTWSSWHSWLRVTRSTCRNGWESSTPTKVCCFCSGWPWRGRHVTSRFRRSTTRSTSALTSTTSCWCRCAWWCCPTSCRRVPPWLTPSSLHSWSSLQPLPSVCSLCPRWAPSLSLSLPYSLPFFLSRSFFLLSFSFPSLSLSPSLLLLLLYYSSLLFLLHISLSFVAGFFFPLPFSFLALFSSLSLPLLWLLSLSSLSLRMFVFFFGVFTADFCSVIVYSCSYQLGASKEIFSSSFLYFSALHFLSCFSLSFSVWLSFSLHSSLTGTHIRACARLPFYFSLFSALSPFRNREFMQRVLLFK